MLTEVDATGLPSFFNLCFNPNFSGYADRRTATPKTKLLQMKFQS